MSHVYLTSFFRSVELPEEVDRWSCAVYQPSGFSFPKAAWTDIRNDQGKWTRPREFLSAERPALEYRNALLDLYESRVDQAAEWIMGLENSAALCCWCPYDKAAQRQMGEFGSFICHTAVLGEFLRAKFSIPVWEDSDRRKMAVLTQTKV